MVLYLFFNGFIRLFYYYYTIVYGTNTLLASILKAWKAWISDIPSWISRWTSCAQVMDSKLPTTCTRPWPQLTHNSISISLTHPYHTTATLTKTYLSYITLRNIEIFSLNTWLWDTLDAGWHCWGQRLQGALSLSKYDRESTPIKMQAVYRLRYPYSRSSDLVSITISLPANLARFLHTFY